jgi:hypothetical protein
MGIARSASMFDWNAWRVAPEDSTAGLTGMWTGAGERLAAQVAASHKQLVGLMQQSFGTWFGAASATEPFAAWASASATHGAAFAKGLAGLPQFGLGDLMGQLASHPALVGNPDSIERLVQRAMQAWGDLQQAAAAHQLVMASGWQQAFAAFAAEFQGGGESRDIRTLEAYLGLWSEIGERALQAHARSPEFVDSQSRMIRAAMQYRLEARRVTEASCRLQDLPTLTDLDEAFAMIHELRREVRLLKRRLDEDERSR